MGNTARLINPVYTRFVKDGRRILVTVPFPYIALVRLTIGVGSLMLGIGLFASFRGPTYGQYPGWWLFVGMLVFIAGTWALYVFDFIDFDLREKTYRRRCGSWPRRRTYRGRISDVDAVVLTCERNDFGGLGPQSFYLRIHWKDRSEMPSEMLHLNISSLFPLNPNEIIQGVAPYGYLKSLEVGNTFANALGVRFFNSSGLPLPPAQTQTGAQSTPNPTGLKLPPVHNPTRPPNHRP